MKSKAKPAKGSARTKRFDVGGTVGALAGLGTLAYLMSRKKKGEDGKAEYKPQGKFPNEDGSGTSGSGMADTTTKVDDAGRHRALAASMGRPEMGDADSESDKALKRTDGGKTAPVVKDNKPKPRLTPKAQVDSSTSTAKSATSKQGSSTNTGLDAGIAAGNRKKPTRLEVIKTLKPGERGHSGSGESKPYPKEEKKKDVTTSINDRNAVTLEKGTGNKEDKKYGIGPYGAFSSIHRALSDTRSEEQKQKSADAIFNATRGKAQNKKAGGAVKKYAAGGAIKASKMGSVKTAKPSMGSASKRADGIAQRGKTRGKVC